MSGEAINLSNYKSKYGTGWRFSNTWERHSGNIYISAPSFVIQYKASSVLLRKCNINVDAYYFEGGSWKYAFSDSCSVSGKNEQSKKFYHNRGAEGTSSYDHPDSHLWWFVVGSGWSGSATTYFYAWTGGIGLYTDAEYNSRCKGKPISYSAGDWWTSYSSQDAFAQAQNPSVYRGTPITDSTGAYVCYSG